MLAQFALILVLAVPLQDPKSTPPGPDDPDPAVVVLPPGEEAPKPAPTPAPGKRPKPKAVMTTSRRILQDPIFGQPETILRVTITDADEQYWCPEIVWIWFNGTQSEQGGDCDPYNQASPNALARQSWSRRIPMTMPPGEWKLKAELRKNGERFQTLEVSIAVTGAN